MVEISTEFLTEVTMWWAGHWNAPERAVDRIPEFTQSGRTRFDYLVGTLGTKLIDSSAERKWGQFEVTLTALVSDVRFHVFRDHHDAAHASLSLTEFTLLQVGYRLKTRDCWKEFRKELLAILLDPTTDDQHVRRCIKRHFDRP